MLKAVWTFLCNIPRELLDVFLAPLYFHFGHTWLFFESLMNLGEAGTAFAFYGTIVLFVVLIETYRNGSLQSFILWLQSTHKKLNEKLEKKLQEKFPFWNIYLLSKQLAFDAAVREWINAIKKFLKK